MNQQSSIETVEKTFEHVLDQFLFDLNIMCRETGRNIVIQEYPAGGESAGGTSRRKVIFRKKFRKDHWVIYAETKSRFFFRKKFPLIKIVFNKNSQCFSLTGLHTGDFVSPVPMQRQALAQVLSRYVTHCRSIPVESFIKT